MPTAGFQVDGTGTAVTVIDMDQLAQMVSSTGGVPLPTEQLLRALWLVSSLTLVVDLSAVFYHPAIGPMFGGHKTAYYCTLAGVLAVVALEMATAYRLPRAGAQLAYFAKALLRFAVLLLLVVVAVGGYGLIIKV